MVAGEVSLHSMTNRALYCHPPIEWVGAISSTPTVAGAITSVSLVGGGREELRGAW